VYSLEIVLVFRVSHSLTDLDYTLNKVAVVFDLIMQGKEYVL
jgi:hypothetical protein